MVAHKSASLSKVADHMDPIWYSVRAEAESAALHEPLLAAFLYSTVLNQDSLEEAVMHRISERLGHADVAADLLRQTFVTMSKASPEWAQTLRIDLQAVYDRDPAANRFLDPLLYMKGFHAIQTHRLAHWLWKEGRKDFAYYLQSRASSIFQTDIHPAAKFGTGIFLDHATGLVVGETAQIADNVSILHAVTLGGTGKAGGDRHPKIGHGVLIGAGAKILGNITVGSCSKIAAGSVVVKSVPDNVTVAGVPAKVIGECDCAEPSRAMDQLISAAE
ncbi:serine O-acetyltransferase [Pseudochrobactrum sp. MP213Fo]|uniref:serine O-acetyltransferase n=1 Tax=Pseudochrobactrum sp. MP213Fo TaxID=3022250 RepID=UPI003BA0019F